MNEPQRGGRFDPPRPVGAVLLPQRQPLRHGGAGVLPRGRLRRVQPRRGNRGVGRPRGNRSSPTTARCASRGRHRRIRAWRPRDVSRPAAGRTDTPAGQPKPPADQPTPPAGQQASAGQSKPPRPTSRRPAPSRRRAASPDRRPAGRPLFPGQRIEEMRGLIAQTNRKLGVRPTRSEPAWCWPSPPESSVWCSRSAPRTRARPRTRRSATRPGRGGPAGGRGGGRGGCPTLPNRLDALEGRVNLIAVGQRTTERAVGGPGRHR